jgi:hypothetical protein
VAVAWPQQSPPAAPPPKTATPDNAEFLKLADEVLAEVSQLISLPVKQPLKKSVRSRDEIREFILREVHEDRDAAKWHADERALEMFGLIPRNFQLQSFVVDLLTEQVAGLYDPRTKEFYISDATGPLELRMVMSHELVHALQDQHFDLKTWSEAARPNDDAELARHSVLEGSAFAAMIEYMLREQKISVKNLPDLEAMVRSQMMGELDKDSQLGKSPAYIRESLLFPYLAGTTFTQKLLRAGGSWEKFYDVFAKPPVSTHQILHPELYLAGETLPPVPLADAAGAISKDWKKLDENTMGEFGVFELLKQFVSEARAKEISPAWAGDSYAIFEHAKTKRALLLFRVRLAADADAARFLGAYSEALEKKYETRSNLLRRPSFFSFDTPLGGVFLYCRRDECLTLEGATRAQFDRVIRALRWPDAPRLASRKPPEKVAFAPASCPPADFCTLYPTL